MSMIIKQPAQAISLPAPRVAIDVRPATLDDFAFIDRLQTAYCKQLGYMPRAQMESKIKAGHVMVAESDEGTEARRHEVTECEGKPLGFVIGTDRYFKRDDCGIIYQLCVEPGQRRGLIGAALVKAMFDRAAYGCRLFCCWCAQDIEANRFWESLGFVPLAYRAGSQKKGRVHIFWQRRVHAGDETTPYWFPSQTTGGSIREDRLVLPITPGTHWSEAKPIILPRAEPRASARGSETIADSPPPEPLPYGRGSEQGTKPAKKPAAKPADPYANALRGFVFASQLPPPAPTPAPKPERPKRLRVKNDPTYVALARELRDRWLEEVNRDPSLLLPAGKYDPARQLPGAPDR